MDLRDVAKLRLRNVAPWVAEARRRPVRFLVVLGSQPDGALLRMLGHCLSSLGAPNPLAPNEYVWELDLRPKDQRTP